MDLSTFINDAWDAHGDDADTIAQQLAEKLPEVQSPAEVPAFASLLAHVYGEHLGRWHDALVLLGRLRGVAAEDAVALAAVQRAERTLRCASGDGEALDDLMAGERAAVLAGAAAMQVGRGDAEAAASSLDAALAVAAEGLPDGSPALRALAVAGNNIAADLQDRPQRSAAETALMLRAAETGLAYWTRAGGWLQVERAEHRLSCCRLAAGEAEAALESARRCLAVCTANDAPAFERFFAHAVQAFAHRALGDEACFAQARDAALACHAQLAVDERPWCEKELAELQAAAPA
ncbi:hypothetical protein [Aquincola tertiaricarbonis]|uniref:hypothetical protein n=1 Tax=Aquincola tertiaricarbonis TaxID=391953 RepID=UPI000696E1B1|nr:hypothetical protein [Aquincola tertiaricarbonis]